MAIKAVQLAGPGPGIIERQAWAIQFTGAAGDDIVNLWNATVAQFSKNGGNPRADDGTLTREGSVLMLKFSKPCTQSEAADTMVKLTSAKFLGPAYKVLPFKTDAVQIVNWKLKQEKAEFPPSSEEQADGAAPADPGKPDNFKGDFKPTELKPATEQMASLSPLERELAVFAKLETAKQVYSKRLEIVTQKLDTK